MEKAGPPGKGRQMVAVTRTAGFWLRRGFRRTVVEGDFTLESGGPLVSGGDPHFIDQRAQDGCRHPLLPQSRRPYLGILGTVPGLGHGPRQSRYHRPLGSGRPPVPRGPPFVPRNALPSPGRSPPETHAGTSGKFHLPFEPQEKPLARFV